MAESKKTGGGKKPVSQTREEAAEALRKAAELISSLNDNGDAKPAAKKTSAKTRPRRRQKSPRLKNRRKINRSIRRPNKRRPPSIAV